MLKSTLCLKKKTAVPSEAIPGSDTTWQEERTREQQKNWFSHLPK